MLNEFAVGDVLPDVSGEGMRVTPGPHGLLIEVICEKEAEIVRAIMTGAPFQLAFFDANPFGWFLLNAGKAGYCDCCWAISRLQKDDVAMMQSCLRGMKEQSSSPSFLGFPALMELADLSGVVYAIMPLEIANDSWRLLATTYLGHPTALTEEELAKEQRRLERKYENIHGFAEERAVWVQNYNPRVEQLPPKSAGR